MRVLIFSAFDPIPSDGILPIRYWRLAEAFLRQADHVVYACPRFFHLMKTYRKDSDLSGLKNRSGLHIELLEAKGYKKNLSLHRFLFHKRLAASLKKFLEGLPPEARPEIVVCANPPLSVNLVLLDWCQKNRVPFVTDIQDLWPAAYSQFVPRSLRWILAPFFRQGRKVVKKATGVVAVSVDYLKYYQKEIGHKPQAVFYICPNEFPELSKNKIRQKRLVYIGSASTNTALSQALQFSRTTGAGIDVIGFGSSGLPSSETIGYFDWREFRKEGRSLADYSAGLCLVNPRSAIAIPNKAYAYFAAGLPVISNVAGGELEKMIAENDLGITLNSIAPQSLSEAVQYCLGNFRDEDYERIRNFAIRNFNGEEVYSHYARWVKELLNFQGSENPERQ